MSSRRLQKSSGEPLTFYTFQLPQEGVVRCANGAWALAAAFVCSTIAALPSAHATAGESGGYDESVREIGRLLSKKCVKKISETKGSASNAGLALSMSCKLASTSLSFFQRLCVKRLTSRAANQVVSCGGFFEREQTAWGIQAPQFLPAELLAVAKLPDNAFWGAKNVKSGAARELVTRGRWLLDVVPKLLKLDPSSPDHEAVSALLGKEKRFGSGVPSSILLEDAVNDFARLASDLNESQDPSHREIADIANQLGSYRQPFNQWSKDVDRAICEGYASGKYFNPMIHR